MLYCESRGLGIVSFCVPRVANRPPGNEKNDKSPGVCRRDGNSWNWTIHKEVCLGRKVLPGLRGIGCLGIFLGDNEVEISGS